jgi:hypothetical protein
MKMIFSVLLVLFPIAVLAQVVAQAPQSVDQAVGMLPVLASFWHNGAYLAFGAGVALILCFVLNQYVFPKLKMGPALVPIASGIIGIIAGVGLAVVNGASLQSASLAVLSGSVATHLWESIFQYFLPQAQPPKA